MELCFYTTYIRGWIHFPVWQYVECKVKMASYLVHKTFIFSRCLPKPCHLRVVSTWYAPSQNLKSWLFSFIFWVTPASYIRDADMSFLHWPFVLLPLWYLTDSINLRDMKRILPKCQTLVFPVFHCEDLRLLFVLRDSEQNVFGFWTVFREHTKDEGVGL